MRRHDATTALVLLTVGLVAVEVSMYSAAAEDQAPREIFLSETRLDTLKRRVEKRIEPTYAAWLDLKSRAEGLLDRRPHAPNTGTSPATTGMRSAIRRPSRACRTMPTRCTNWPCAGE